MDIIEYLKHIADPPSTILVRVLAAHGESWLEEKHIGTLISNPPAAWINGEYWDVEMNKGGVIIFHCAGNKMVFLERLR